MEYAFLTQPDQATIVQLIALYKEVGWWTLGRDNHRMLSRIVEGSHCFMVAREDGVIVGMGRAISDRASDAYLQDIAVRPDQRGKGVGREIVSRLVGRLHEDGIHWVALIAEGKATSVYRKEGFVTMENATPMWKRDGVHGT